MSAGKFCWFDLMTTDVAAARAFYVALFDWDVRDHSGEYCMIHDRAGRALGGMMAASPGVPSSWLPYVTVDDIGGALAKVTELGGRVYMRHTAPEVGEFAIYADVQGAVIAALQPSRPLDPYPREKGESHICWSELHTSAPAAALVFYTGVFGWKSEAWGADYFMIGDEHAGGIMAGRPGVPPHWLIYVNSTDTDATAASVVRLGGRIVAPPQDLTGVGRFAVFADPTGGVFAVMQSVRRD